MREWILPAIGTFIFWGVWGFIPKLTTKYIDSKSAVVYEVIGGILVAVILLYILNFRPESHPRGIVLAMVTGVVGFLGSLTFLIAASRGQISLVVSLTALYPALSILLAIVILNEPITLKQGMGIFLALIAMLLVAT
jgi:transporter family protein